MSTPRHVLKIHVMQVPDEGLDLDVTCSPEDWDMARDDLQPTAPIHVRAHAIIAEHQLLVQASMTCVVQCNCARCAIVFDHTIQKACVLHYDVSRRHVVDMRDDIREEIMLDYPPVVLCHETCRGLCARCGHNLNTGTCAHDPHDAKEQSHGES